MGSFAAPAVISDIDDSSLKVQGNNYTPMEEIGAKAKEGCAIYDKKPFTISFNCLDYYCTRKDYLYACK